MMRVLIADDEAPARRKIHDLLAAEADVKIVGEAASGLEAVALIRERSPDLVFLDIQMPRLDGFGVVQEIGLKAMPLVVFVTAYDQHALKAFEVHALDYLLKPFAAARFRRLLERVRQRLAEARPAELAGRMEQLLKSMQPAARPAAQILVEKGAERQVLLAVDDIDRVQSEKNYLRLFSGQEEYLRRGSLNEFEQRLDPEQFLRINRSEIVRLGAVREFQPWFHGDYRVVMKDGTVRSWSRRFRARSKDRF